MRSTVPRVALVVFLLLALTDHCMATNGAICAYTARLSAHDKINGAGQPLVRRGGSAAVAEALRPHRAHYHARRKRDAEDTGDCLFSTLDARQSLSALARSGFVAPALARRIVEEEVLVRVEIFPAHIRVSALEDITTESSMPVLLAEPDSPTRPLMRRCADSGDRSCVERDRFKALCTNAKGTTRDAFANLLSRLNQERNPQLVSYANMRAHHLTWRDPEDLCEYKLTFSATINGQHHFVIAFSEISAFAEADGGILAAEIVNVSSQSSDTYGRGLPGHKN